VSLEYTIDLVTRDAAEDVRRVAADAVARAGGAGGAVATAPLSYAPTRQMYRESFGFEPTVTVVVPIDKHAPPGPARDAHAVAALAALLARYDGGLYAQLAGVQPVALRRGPGEAPTVDAEWLALRPWARDALPAPLTEGAVPQPE
jgi:hypothetical protein